MSSALRHVRHNAVAYLALFVALGGTSYAAINLPKGSVGSSQLKNHSIAPVKFNGKYINGAVRAWAVVAPDGTVQASAGKPSVRVETSAPGAYVIKWQVIRPSQRGCFAFGGIPNEAEESGSAEAQLFVPSKGPWAVDVATYGPDGQRLAQFFYVAVVC